MAKGTEAASLPDTDTHAIPKGSHWVDMADAGTIVVIEQPTGQACAAIGGIMALAMKRRGAEGCLVGGRVRDLEELSNSSLPVRFPCTWPSLPYSLLLSIPSPVFKSPGRLASVSEIVRT